MSQARARALALHRRRPLIADVGLVVLLLAPLSAARVGDVLSTPEARAFSVALVLPLLARRRWPREVFATIAVIALAQWSRDVRAFGDVALLVALYTVAVSQPARATLAAFAVLEVGVVLAALRFGAGEDALRAVTGLSGLAVAAAVTGTSSRNRAALLLTLQERAERLETERDQQGRLAASAERARIAREMHDIVAHNVSVMIALSDGAGYAVREDPDRAADAMRRASATGRNALREMRRLLGVLREDDGESRHRAPQPGLAELELLLEHVRAAGLPVRYETDGPPPPLPAGLQLAVYRVVQEALTNTLKHAGPGVSAAVKISHRADLLEVDVSDSGGHRPERPAWLPGAGLRGMRERAAVYDGIVEAGPVEAGGWRVRLSTPLQPAAVTA